MQTESCGYPLLAATALAVRLKTQGCGGEQDGENDEDNGLDDDELEMAGDDGLDFGMDPWDDDMLDGGAGSLDSDDSARLGLQRMQVGCCVCSCQVIIMCKQPSSLSRSPLVVTAIYDPFFWIWFVFLFFEPSRSFASELLLFSD